MIWQAIGENGQVSVPYFAKGTMNAKTYLEQCIKKIMVPFIDSNYSRDKVLFWPDMARVHYTAEIREYLDSMGIRYVTWKQNAPNVPQVRPIEKSWALCKAKYARKAAKPKSSASFQRIWRNIGQEVADRSGLALMSGLRSKVLKLGRRGVYAAI